MWGKSLKNQELTSEDNGGKSSDLYGDKIYFVYEHILGQIYSGLSSFSVNSNSAFICIICVGSRLHFPLRRIKLLHPTASHQSPQNAIPRR